MRAAFVAALALLVYAAPATAQSEQRIDTIKVGPNQEVTGATTIAADVSYKLVITGTMSAERSQGTPRTEQYDAFYCFSSTFEGDCQGPNNQASAVYVSTTDDPGYAQLAYRVEPDRKEPPQSESHAYTVSVRFTAGGQLEFSTKQFCGTAGTSCGGDGFTIEVYSVGSAPPPPPPGGDRPAAPKFKVTSIRNEAAFRVNAGDWRPIKAGDEVTQDMELFTGVDSGMTVDMGDGSVFRLDELTQLLVDTIARSETRKDVAVRLVVGRVSAQIKKEQVVDTNFEIQTPTATTSVRGTVFSVFYDPGTKASLVTVSEGAVAVMPKRAGGRELLVSAGREVEVTPSGTSALAPLGKAGARGGVNRFRARALVLDKLDAAARRCRITVARSTAGLRVATARGGWLVRVKVSGRASGTSTWKVRRGKARPRNGIAKRIARRCR